MSRAYTTVPLGDVYFPPVEFADWRLLSQQQYEADERHSAPVPSRSMSAKVGLCVNPMSGRDVRRLAARASNMTHEAKRDIVAGWRWRRRSGRNGHLHRSRTLQYRVQSA